MRSLYWRRSSCWLRGWGWAWEVVVGGSSEEEEVWEGGAVTGQGLGSGTPTVGAAEAAGPTATAEGHGEGDHRVHTRRAAGEPDGGKAQLTVGAHRLGHRRQRGRQHPHLEAVQRGGGMASVCPAPSPPLISPLPPTNPRLGYPGDPLCSPSHMPSSDSSSPAPTQPPSRPLPPVSCGPGLSGPPGPLRVGSSPCWGSSRHRCWW